MPHPEHPDPVMTRCSSCGKLIPRNGGLCNSCVEGNERSGKKQSSIHALRKNTGGKYVNIATSSLPICNALILRQQSESRRRWKTREVFSI
jgi:hypothetical protein